MNKYVARCIFLSVCAILFSAVIAKPSFVSDANVFLKDFSGDSFLSFMGVLVTISLTSAANIHLELRKMEERAKREVFANTRRKVCASAYSLIWALVVSVILVVTKPIVTTTERSEAVVNSLLLLVVLFSILVVTDVTKLAFRISPLDLEKK